MTIERAIKHLCMTYGKARADDTILKPVSWSLYQTWKWCDSIEKSKDAETEVWNGIHAQIEAPKGTFNKIFNEAKEDDDEI